MKYDRHSWLMKQKAIKQTYNCLSDDLKKICNIYMWGEYSYLNWMEIGKQENYAKTTIYRLRRKILTNYAEKLGEIY